MSVTRGVVSSVVRNVVRGVVRAPSEIQRYFTESNSVTQTHGVPTSTPTITRLVMDVYSPTGSNVGLPTGAPVPTANKLETIDFAFAGTMPDIARNGANYFDGIIANVYAYNGATLVGFWPMDDAPSATYFRNDAAVLGSELVTPNTLDDWFEPRGASTLSLADGYVRSVSDSTATFGASYEMPSLTLGGKYRVKLKIRRVSGSGGTIFPRLASTVALSAGNLSSFSGADTSLDLIVEATATTMYLGFVQAGHTAGEATEILIESIKEIPAATPLIEKINYVKADTQPYTQVDVGWTGPELVVNGGFDTDTDWAKQAGVTIAGGLLSTDGTTNGELARQSNLGLIADNVYRVTIVISELTQGSIGVKIGGGASTTYSVAGTYTIDISDGTLDNLQISGTLNAIGSVASISCKRLIEVV
jgi:hypothetical protein